MRTFAKTAVCLTSTAAMTLAASSAFAGGFSVARFGGEHGHPTTSEPTAIYYNPAGIAASKGINIFADGNIALRYARFEPGDVPADSSERQFDEPSGGIGANTSKAGLFNVAAAPMLGVTGQYDFTETIGAALGIGFFVPFGGSSTWDENEAFRDHPQYVGAVDGSQRWWAIHGTIRTMYLSAAAGVSISDMIYLGLSGGLAFSNVDSIRARNGDGSNQISNAAGSGKGYDGRAWLDAAGTQGHLGAGAMVEPIADKLRIGLSYQAPPGFFDGVEIRGLLKKNLGGNVTGTTEGPDNVQMNYTLPDIFRLGVSYQATDRMQLRLFGDVQRWSLFQDQCIASNPNFELDKDQVFCEIEENGSPKINPDTGERAKVAQNVPRRWDDSFGVRAGMSYWPLDDLEAMAGVGYDSNAVPDEYLEPGILDFHDVSVSLGARLQVVEELGISLSYTHLFYIPRTIDAGVHRPAQTGDNGADGESCTADDPGFCSTSAGPDAAGTYKQSIGVINVNLQVSFDPFTSDETPAVTAKRSKSIPGLH